MRLIMLVFLFAMVLLPTSAYSQAACGVFNDPDLGQNSCTTAFWPTFPDGEAISQTAFDSCRSCFSDAFNLCDDTDGAIVTFAQCLPQPSRIQCAELQDNCQGKCADTLPRNASEALQAECVAGCNEGCQNPGVFYPEGAEIACVSVATQLKTKVTAACTASQSKFNSKGKGLSRRGVADCKESAETKFKTRKINCHDVFGPVLIR